MMKTLAIALLAAGLCFAVPTTDAGQFGARQGCLTVVNTTHLPHLNVFVPQLYGGLNLADDCPVSALLVRYGGKPILVAEENVVTINVAGPPSTSNITLKKNPKATFRPGPVAGLPACPGMWVVKF